MLILFMILVVFGGLFWLAFQITGAILVALIWLCVKLPIATMLLALGIICFCTILLIPVGIGLWKAAIRLLLP